MSDTNDKNKIRRKTVSSRDKDLTAENRSRNSSDDRRGLRIKKQVSSGSGEINKRSKSGADVYDFQKYKSRNRSEKSHRDRSEYDYRMDYDIEDEYDEEDNSYRVDRSRIYYILRKVLTIVLIITVVLGSAGFLYVRSIVSDMPVLTKKMVRESYINKQPVSLDKIPKDLQKAVIAVEDDSFDKHKGINYKSMFRSFFNNLTSEKKQGGSTIDMQLSKNLLTSNERTIKRKIQDMYNARQLNKIMTKDEILEAYLNNIYLGKSAYGVESGAQLYFGKSVWKLTFGESTMLAGITNNPGLYQNYEQAKKRQAVVCLRMFKLGMIKEHVYKAQLYRDTPFKSEIDR